MDYKNSTLLVNAVIMMIDYSIAGKLVVIASVPMMLIVSKNIAHIIKKNACDRKTNHCEQVSSRSDTGRYL